MKYEFYVNDDIDMSEIKDSMQIDSETTIATLKMTKNNVTLEASLEVRGEVKVWWNPNGGDPQNGDYYKYPSEFPQELKDRIANSEYSEWTTDSRVYVSENNWFELFISNVTNGPDPIPTAYVVDAEQSKVPDLFSLLYDALIEEFDEYKGE